MERDQHAVGRQVNVSLQIAVAEVDRVPEGGKRVFRDLLGTPTVGEGKHAGMVEDMWPGTGRH